MEEEVEDVMEEERDNTVKCMYCSPQGNILGKRRKKWRCRK
jgi:predicted amidohydrolase